MMDWIVFGKTPLEGDFVRDNLRSPVGVAFFRWLSDAVGSAGHWAKRLPPTGVKFVLGLRAHPGSLRVGVMVPSRDKVGREFPLVACLEGPRDALARKYPAVPVAWSSCLSAARAILDEGRAAPIGECAQRLKDLPNLPPLDDSYSRVAHALCVASSADFHERLFADVEHDPHYAYQTVRVAAQTIGKATAPALLCPIASPTDVVAWLELVRRVAPTSDFVPSFLWTGGERPSVIICLDDPPPAILPVLGGDAGEAARVWPLSTNNQVALQKARTSIAPLLPPPTAPFEAVIEALSGR